MFLYSFCWENVEISSLIYNVASIKLEIENFRMENEVYFS